jgi:hypothetical protein
MINELQRLSREMNAKVTLVIEDGYARVSFKAKGHSTEAVTDGPLFGSATPVDQVVTNLLNRLGVKVHTQTEFIRLVRQRPAKLALLKSLLAQIRDIRRDVFIAVEDIEPVLASPRSSLNPQFMEGGDE